MHHHELLKQSAKTLRTPTYTRIELLNRCQAILTVDILSETDLAVARNMWAEICEKVVARKTIELFGHSKNYKFLGLPQQFGLRKILRHLARLFKGCFFR